MKTRHGFVSNSSSSSFLVLFKNVPGTVADMQKMLFGDKPYLESPYKFEGDVKYPALDVATDVFNDMSRQKPMTEREIIETIGSGWFDGYPDLDDFKLPDPAGYDWTSHSRAGEIAAQKTWDKFVAAHGEGTIYKFHYSDNDGCYGSTMEHGDLFVNLPHIRISHH